jgi:hypothetical protein
VEDASGPNGKWESWTNPLTGYLIVLFGAIPNVVLDLFFAAYDMPTAVPFLSLPLQVPAIGFQFVGFLVIPAAIVEHRSWLDAMRRS